MPVTYDKYGADSTVVNENYCAKAVHLVPVITLWLMVAVLALGGLCTFGARAFVYLTIYLFKKTMMQVCKIIFGRRLKAADMRLNTKVQ